MSESERRFTPGRVEVRAAAADKRTIGGYAAKFNRMSAPLGGFVERIDVRAFNDSHGRDWPDVLARYNHDDNLLLGTSTARTLRLDLDEIGLLYDVDVPQSRADVYELVQRGDVNKSSFAFRVIGDGGDEWGLSDQNYPMRTLLNVQLVDVAPVNVPAYTDTSTGLRSLAQHMQAPMDEVRKLAETDELRQFFVRGDKSAASTRQTFGPAARMALLSRQQDPYA